jgi:hypothetical protein
VRPVGVGGCQIVTVSRAEAEDHGNEPDRPPAPKISYLFAAPLLHPLRTLDHRLHWSARRRRHHTAPAPTTTDDKPLDNHEDHDLRLGYWATTLSPEEAGPARARYQERISHLHVGKACSYDIAASSRAV